MKILYFFDHNRKAVIAVNESMKDAIHAYELTALATSRELEDFSFGIGQTKFSGAQLASSILHSTEHPPAV